MIIHIITCEHIIEGYMATSIPFSSWNRLEYAIARDTMVPPMG